MTPPPNNRATQSDDLLSLTSDWYWEQDAEFRYTYYSERFYALTGSTPGERIGTHHWDHAVLNMDAGDWAAHRRQLDAHERFLDLELCVATPGGGQRWCSVSGTPVFSADGAFEGYRGVARDITARKEAEASLERTHRRLETAIEAGGFGIWETDLKARQVYLSPGWSSMLGGPPEPTLVALEDLIGISHPEDLVRLQAAQRAAIRGETGEYECRHRVRHRDGSWRWVHSRGRITERSPDGRALRMTGTNMDVTAEVLAGQALREKEAEQRTVLSSVPAMIARIDRSYRFAYANRSYAESAGHTPESIVGLAVADAIGAERAADSEPWFRRALAGETVTFKRTTPDGRGGNRHFDVTLTPDRDADGGVRGCFALVTEFTATANAQAVLREKERELRHLLDSIPAVVARIGLDGKYTYVNRRFAAEARASEADVIGRSVFDVLGSKYGTKVSGFLKRVATGEMVEYERAVAGPEGERRHFHVNFVPDLGGSGTVVGAYMFGIDITARKSEERRAQALLAQLTNANEELESFAYSVSHDLRAPLRAIGGFAEVLERSSTETLDHAGLGHLRRITSNARRMTDLIDGLLRLSQLARHPLQKRRLLLAPLVAEVVADHEAEIAQRDLRVEIGELPVCCADPVLLKQVFANLVSNAFKYTSKRAAAEVSIGARPSAGGTAYFVSDNGAGFDMNYADKLFGVFQRLHGESEFPGTGIGLATVKRIVERHGGRVWAEGAEGKGATFLFTLAAA